MDDKLEDMSVTEENARITNAERERPPEKQPLINPRDVREYDLLRHRTGQYRLVEHINDDGDIYARVYGSIIDETTPKVAINIKEAIANGEYTLAHRNKIEIENRTNQNTPDSVIFRDEVLQALASGKRSLATEKIVKKIRRNNHIYTLRHDDKPQIWIYQDGVYVPHGRTYIEEITRDVLGEAYTTQLHNDVVRKIQADTYIDQEEFFQRGDENPHLLPVKNGILDINTRKLKPFTPEMFFFNKLPVLYIPDAKCPRILEFINDIVRPGDSLVLQEYTGFLLLREYRYEKSLMLYGGGRNGKGKLLTLLKKLLGADNVSNISLQDIESDQFAKGELHGKLANIAGDLSRASIQHSGAFKELTGRDTIQAARKYLPRIQFVNYAKMVFGGNEIPRTNDMTLAFFDRWILIEFPYTFLPQDKIKLLSKEERENVKPRNPQIIEEITNDNELSGFLNWALEGYARLTQNEDFTYSSTSEQVRTAWIRKSDSFLAFCQGYVREDYNGEVSKSALRQAYQRYCRENHLRGASDRDIKKTLAENYGATDGRSSSEGRETIWTGIKLLDEPVKDVKDVRPVSTSIEISNLIECSKQRVIHDKYDKTVQETT